LRKLFFFEENTLIFNNMEWKILKLLKILEKLKFNEIRFTYLY
jgi:hypothetical protein